MIKNITSNGTYIQVHHGYHNIPPMSPGAQSAGLLRYNGNNQCVEVYNGMAWYPIDDTNISIDLSEYGQEIFSWAEQKMLEERKLKDLMERHPGLKDLHDKFEIMKVLCIEEERR
jgi:hypothetical protein